MKKIKESIVPALRWARVEKMEIVESKAGGIHTVTAKIWLTMGDGEKVRVEAMAFPEEADFSWHVYNYQGKGRRSKS